MRQMTKNQESDFSLVSGNFKSIGLITTVLQQSIFWIATLWVTWLALYHTMKFRRKGYNESAIRNQTSRLWSHLSVTWSQIEKSAVMQNIASYHTMSFQIHTFGSESMITNHCFQFWVRWPRIEKIEDLAIV